MTRRDDTGIEDGHDTHVDAELRGLLDRLESLARAELPREAPPYVETTVLRAWDAAHPAPERVAISWARWASAAAVIATVSTVAAISLQRRAVVDGPARQTIQGSDVRLAAEAPATREVTTRPSPAPRRVEPARTAVTAPVERPIATTLVLVGPPVMAGERVRVVRVRVARETLRGMGLRPAVQDDAASVDVEMLVGEDGVARGLRVRM